MSLSPTHAYVAFCLLASPGVRNIRLYLVRPCMPFVRKNARPSSASSSNHALTSTENLSFIVACTVPIFVALETLPVPTS